MKRTFFLFFGLFVIFPRSVWGGPISSPSPAASRKPYFKGVELYSWPQERGFSFAILPGTNRLKTWDEVSSQAMTFEATHSQLQNFAPGETVTWNGQIERGARQHLSCPPAEISEKLHRLAAERKFSLFGCPADPAR